MITLNSLHINPAKFNPRNPAHMAVLKKRIALAFQAPALGLIGGQNIGAIDSGLGAVRNYISHESDFGAGGSVRRNVIDFPGMRQEISAAVRNQQGAVRNTTESGDYPAVIERLVRTFVATPYVDDSPLVFFDQIPSMMGATGFDIGNIDGSNIRVQVMYPGERIEYNGSTMSSYHVFYTHEGGGVARSLWLLNENTYHSGLREINMLLQRAYARLPQTAASLIEAIPAGQDIAWQNPVPATLPNTDATYVAKRDAETLNAGCLKLIQDNKDKGLGFNINQVVFDLVYPFEMHSRWVNAVNVLTQGNGNGTKVLQYNVKLQQTTMFSSSDYSYLGIRGGNTVYSWQLNPSVFTKNDYDNYTAESALWQGYAAAIGDTEQMVRLSKS